MLIALAIIGASVFLCEVFVASVPILIWLIRKVIAPLAIIMLLYGIIKYGF